MLKKKRNWRTDIDILLSRFENTEATEEISISMIATTIGVSRQTLWRNKEIMKRISLIKSVDNKRPTKLSPSQKNQLVIEKLYEKIQSLENDKNALIFRVVEIYTKLSNDGIDPLDYIDETIIPPR